MGLPIMRWPSKTASSTKFIVTLTVQELRGWNPASFEDGLTVFVTWKGPKAGRKSFTWKSAPVDYSSTQPGGVWIEEFHRECVFAPVPKGKGPAFQAWDVQLAVRKTSSLEKEKPLVLGKADLDLAPYAATGDVAPQALELALSAPDAGVEGQYSLLVSLCMQDLREDSDAVLNSFHTLRASSLGLPEAPLPPVFMGPQIPLSSPVLAGGKGSMASTARKSESLRVDDDCEDMSEHNRAKAGLGLPDRKLVRVLSGFRSKSKLASKEPQGPWVDIIDLSVQAPVEEGRMFGQQPGEETEEEDMSTDSALYYGNIAGVNIAVANDIAVPDLLPILVSCPEPPSTGVVQVLSSENSDSQEDAAVDPPAATGASAQVGSSSSSSLRFFKLSLVRRSGSGRSPADSVAIPGVQDQDDESDTEDMPEGRMSLSLPNLLRPASSSGSSWFGGSKRKLDARSPRPEMEEPLLDKDYGEDGGDEIDWDRRQAEESSEHSLHLLKLSRKEHSQSATDLSASLFGDEDCFEVGQWSGKEIVSRDSRAMINSDVFFASIDQCHEKAGGAGACTSLVVLLAEWLHTHPRTMPTKAEFDSIIKDGSAEWRRLCEIDAHKERFRDRHFDLDTVLKARNGGLKAPAEHSFIGVFQLDGVREGEARGSQAGAKGVGISGAGAVAAGPSDAMTSVSRMVEGLMSFDSIWEEVVRSGEGVYILSWNDHFFVLCVQQDCCFVLDTLGQRLYEGCNQAYIIRFDSTTVISHVEVPPPPPQATTSAIGGSKAAAAVQAPAKVSLGLKAWLAPDPLPPAVPLPSPPPPSLQAPLCDEPDGTRRAAGLATLPGSTVSTGPLPVGGPGSKGVGKDSAVQQRVVKDQVRVSETVTAMQLCGMFIKEFFAAVPVRELQNDIARGQVKEHLVHRTLQVEIHRTQMVGR
eukprot:TRINITY_DN228_c0_g2_i1.p1 TRINITY_DN228_c0_g2~~TRINITY_DN228_c0_g2_i1.p1  ORF type:complete len:921 (+),score=141.66 TRINITY_DN228_c0_g2_i1:233-2995(+)